MREHYYIPTPDELTVKLAGKKIFTVIDISDGFHQIELTKQSSLLCTFNTPMSRFRFKRLPFDLVSSPEIFQRENDRLFGDIPGVLIYFDDIIIAASTETQHDSIMDEVMRRAVRFNVKFNKQKI